MTSTPDRATLAARSARALGWSWAGAGVRAVLQLGVQIVIARLIGPESFGQAAAVLLVIGIATLIGEWGLGAALIQREGLAVGDTAIALGWVLVAASTIGLAVLLLAAPLARWLGDVRLEPLLWAAAAIVPLQAVAALPSAILQRRFQIKRLQLIQLVAYALAYGGLGVALAAAGAGPWSLIAAFALHAVVLVIWAGHAARDHHWVPRLGGVDERRTLLGYGGRTTAANLVNWGIESVDRLAVSTLAGPAALGPYSAAANLARAPVALLVSSAQPVAFAAASRLQDERQRLARGWLAVLALALLVALPLFTFLAWHAEAVVALLYGPAWAAAAAPFAWLCVGVPFFVMLALTGPMLRGMDAVGSEMRAQAGVLLVMVLALVLVLVMASSVSLAAVAALVCGATAARALVLSLALARRLALPLALPWRAGAGGLVLAAVVLGVSAAVAQAELAGLPALLLSALVAVPLAALVLRASRGALLGDTLATALSNRRADLPLAALLCRWARLP